MWRLPRVVSLRGPLAVRGAARPRAPPARRNFATDATANAAKEAEGAGPAGKKPKGSWRPSRGTLIFGSVVLIYAGARTYDKFTLEREKVIVLSQAHKLAELPGQDGAAPRHIVVIRAPGGKAAYQFDTFVKPVLDAAAIDYTFENAVTPQEAAELAHTLRLHDAFGRPVDSVVVLGTTLWRGVCRMRAVRPCERSQRCSL